jgi:hypothetical protein
VSGLWVRSELLPDGSYGVGLSVGEDHAWALTREQAIGYAVACIARATEAEHDAALHRLLIGTVGLDDATARAVVGDLGEHWPEPEAPRSEASTG